MLSADTTAAPELSTQEVCGYLCNYDPRNPLSAELVDPDDPDDRRAPDCSCDNCFYGRHRLADALLRERG